MALWIDLVNSDWSGHLGGEPRRDRLDDPRWLAKLLAAAGTPSVDPRSASLRAELRRLRGCLRRMVERGWAGQLPRPTDVARLNGLLGKTPVRARLERQGGGLRQTLTPCRADETSAVWAIAHSAARFWAEGDLGRLRRCANPTCGWIFLDGTRSRTARWCGGTCRSLIKVRQLRARKRAAARAPSA